MNRRTLSLAALSLVSSGLLLAVACSSNNPVSASDDASTPEDSGGGPAMDAPVVSKDSGSGGDAGTGSDGSTDATSDAPEDATEPTDAYDAGCASPRSTTTLITGTITSDTSWTCDNVYLVHGVVEILPPATLTIAPGTTVLMSSDPTNNGSLIVAPGAQMNAVGTPDLPIVFTSSALGAGDPGAPGDWGTIAFVGLAPGNWGVMNGTLQTSGSPDQANAFPSSFPFPFNAGSDDPTHNTDSSGTLEYVRIEYGGNVAVTPDGGAFGSATHEMLGMYGVGSGTLLDHVDIRQGKFGCMFAQGGQFRARHMICQYGGESGGFDFTRGNQSLAQFLLVQEDPTLSSEGIGFKGAGDSNQLPPLTNPTVYNVTSCGTFGGSDAKDPYAFFMRHGPAGTLANFIGSGYYGGVGMTGGESLSDGGILTAASVMESSILYANQDPRTDAGTNIDTPLASTYDTDLTAWFDTAGWNNATTNPSLTSCTNAASLQAYPATSLTTNAATPPSVDAGADAADDDFFDTTATYIGAFKDSSDTWATGKWVVWKAN